MKKIINNYLHWFLHPSQIYNHLLDSNQFKIGLVENLNEQNDNLSLSYTEVISVSWIFNFIKSIYSIIIIWASYSFIATPLMKSDISFALPATGQKIMMLSSISFAVIFPIYSYLYFFFWEIVISFLMSLFGKSYFDKKKIQQVLISSFTSNILLLVPVFGSFLRYCISIFYFFIGLRRNLKLSTTQSVLVLLIPVFVGLMIFATMILIPLFFIMLLAR
jgi:hypothetical protein